MRTYYQDIDFSPEISVSDRTAIAALVIEDGRVVKDRLGSLSQVVAASPVAPPLSLLHTAGTVARMILRSSASSDQATSDNMPGENTPGRTTTGELLTAQRQSQPLA